MITKDVKKRKNDNSFDKWDWLVVGLFVTGLIAGVIFIGIVIGGAINDFVEAQPEPPERVTLLREGTVEDMQFFQHGALNESRTFINFTDARSLIIGGHQPFEEGVRYRIWYQEYPYQFDWNVPIEAHVTLMQYEEA